VKVETAIAGLIDTFELGAGILPVQSLIVGAVTLLNRE
jgi:hypothetical protein